MKHFHLGCTALFTNSLLYSVFRIFEGKTRIFACSKKFMDNIPCFSTAFFLVFRQELWHGLLSWFLARILRHGLIAVKVVDLCLLHGLFTIQHTLLKKFQWSYKGFFAEWNNQHASRHIKVCQYSVWMRCSPFSLLSAFPSSGRSILLVNKCAHHHLRAVPIAS